MNNVLTYCEACRSFPCSCGGRWPHPSTGYYGQTQIHTDDVCFGKSHVFACAHEPRCQCGTTQRVKPELGNT